MTASSLSSLQPRITFAQRNERYRTQIQTILGEVRECRRLTTIIFDPLTFVRYYEGRERAQITIRSLGHLLGVELSETVEEVGAALERAARVPLHIFAEEVAPGLFERIDAIRPEDERLDDSRETAEKLHYAWLLRAALLQHLLAAVNKIYEPPRFESLPVATKWVAAFSDVLQEAEIVLDGTRGILEDEALALQSVLDGARLRLERLEREARSARVLVTRDWRTLVDEAEDEIIGRLSGAAERLDQLTFETLDTGYPDGWLASVAVYTQRYAPRLGLLLLSIAAASTAGQRVRDLQLERSGGSQAETIGIGTTSTQPTRGVEVPAGLGIAARQSRSTSHSEGGAVRRSGKVATFFKKLPHTRGRQTLNITSPRELEETLNSLERFGYGRSDLLALLGLPVLDAFNHQISLDIRMGAGGRPLLFPVNRDTATGALAAGAGRRHSTGDVVGDVVASVGATFGVDIDTLLRTSPARPETHLSPGPNLAADRRREPVAAARSGTPHIAPGATLGTIADLIGTSVTELAELNGVTNREQWIYQGEPLVLPVEVLVAEPRSVQLQGDSRVVRPATSTPGSVVIGALSTDEAFVVHIARTGETLPDLAARYDTLVTHLFADNPHLRDREITGGQIILVRQPIYPQRSGQATVHRPMIQGGGPSPQPLRERTVTAALEGDSHLERLQMLPDRETILETYGAQRWNSVEEMPPEVRSYFVGTVVTVADFFGVRSGDIAAILRAEQNGAGWTLLEDDVSSAGAVGVAQVVARTWNGWSNPSRGAHSHSLAEIERYGGLGFDWSARDRWQAWKRGALPLSALEETHADPRVFENGVAAIARHLLHWGLTTEAFERDPEGFEVRLADAVAVYNSGRPLAQSRNFKQSATNGKTVGAYVEEVLATSAAWEEALAHEPLMGVAGNVHAERQAGTGGGYLETAATHIVVPETRTERVNIPGTHEEPRSVRLRAPAAPMEAPRPEESARAAALMPNPGAGRFPVTPLQPMPRVFKPFGAPVSYQAGGRHTGIDVAGPDGGTLYAVADGVVAHVGPLYCDRPNACRGSNAVVLEVGDNVYAIYSHNSSATVAPGELVRAGDAIGQQGNEGYSFGSHLHFEVHVGAPFSGDWQQPFAGGAFVDPLDYLPDQ